MKKNKLIIFFPSINNGGNEKNFFSTANNLNKNNVSVAIITCSKKKIEKKINFKNNLNFFDLDFLGLNLKLIICFFYLIFCNKKKIPILSFQGNIFSIIASKIIGCKVFIRFNSHPENFIKNSFKEILFKYIYKKADGVIVNSQEIKNYLIRKFNIKSNLIRNEIDIKKIKELSKKKININFFKNKKKKLLISVGRLDRNKNHYFIIDALSRLEEKYKFNLIILGSGYLKKYLEKLIQKKNLKNFIKIISFKKNPYPYINNSDCLILSSFYEGYPNVLIEAGALNKFIISSDCKSGPREIICKNSNGYLFKSNNYFSFRKKIIQFHNLKKNNIKINNLKNFIMKHHTKNNSKKFKKLIFQN